MDGIEVTQQKSYYTPKINGLQLGASYSWTFPNTKEPSGPSGALTSSCG